VTDDVLEQLAVATPRRVLEDLAKLGHALAKAERARPEVELVLASGHVVRGRIARVADGHALVVVGGSRQAPAVAFVPADQIAAVTVADASLLVRAPVPDAPVPSRLELARQLAARGEALGKRFELGGASELDDDGRRAIGVTLPIVADVLSKIASDAMGKEALAAIDTVELGAATSGDVQRSGMRLVVRAPKLLADQFTHAALRRAIEKLL